MALAKCFKFKYNKYRAFKFFNFFKFKGAIIFFIFLFLFLIRPCYAEFNIKISGLPEWLKPAVARSLSAVWAEIPDAQNIDKTGTLELVASRLFAGYRVNILNKNDGINAEFLNLENLGLEKNNKSAENWEVKIITPELRGMTLNWFNKDIEGLSGEVYLLIKDLPAAALSWADNALKDALLKIIERRLPGWDFSVQASLKPEVLTLLFRPAPPLILAIAPSLYSRTIPAMFRSDLEAKLIPGLSPLIGLPVKWAEVHKIDIENAARNFLEDRNSVDNMRASANVNFKSAPVADLEARVDSDRFLFQVWVAAYAGIKDRYPEAGVFFGWNTAHLTGLPLELYAEALIELGDWDFTGRLGARYEFFHDLWIGAEMQWPDDLLFARVYWGSNRKKRPYAWWRWNNDLGHEGALGYRLDDHISIEIYYDGTKNDKIGFRGQWSL